MAYRRRPPRILKTPAPVRAQQRIYHQQHHNEILARIYRIFPQAKTGPWKAIKFWTRLWLRVYPRGDCWEYRGSQQRYGHGLICRHGRALKVHRVVYVAAKGPIPKGWHIHHICAHPWCCRPSHLLAVTPAEHARYSPNARKTHCPRGHPYTAANTYVFQNRRSCRQCHYEQSRAWRDRQPRTERTRRERAILAWQTRRLRAAVVCSEMRPEH